jgi:hypothetical protein
MADRPSQPRKKAGVADWGVDTALVNPLRERLGASSERDLARLVEEYNLPYRLVRALSEAIAPAGEPSATAPNAEPLPGLYRLAAGLDGAAASDPNLAAVARAIAGAPPPIHDLDHVAATPETVLRRALLIKRRYNFDGVRILFLGDHDLTSIACALTLPSARIAVCDIDERLLEHVQSLAKEHGLSIATYWTDLRVRLSSALRGGIDLVVTDPPYSARGIELFCARAIESLTSSRPTAILLCYGSSLLRPDLAYDVQEAMSRLRLLWEAILPGFNKYRGAPAIGGQSDLYVLRPTRRSAAAAAATAAKEATQIYSHGEASAEARACAVPDAAREVIAGAVAGSDLEPTYVGLGWEGTAPAAKPIGLARYFSTLDAPPSKARGLVRPHAGCIAVSLLGGYERLWWQVIASANARLLILVGGAELDRLQRPAPGLDAVADLVESKYEVRHVQRDQPSSSRIAVLERAVGGQDPARFLYRSMCERWPAKIANSLREALIALHARDGAALTKNAARDFVDASPVARFADKQLCDLTVGELGEALSAIAALAQRR